MEKFKTIASCILFVVWFSIMTVGIFGCDNKATKQERAKQESVKPIKYNVINPQNCWVEFYIVEGYLGKDRHQYLTSKASTATYTFIHYPSCKYCKSTKIE